MKEILAGMGIAGGLLVFAIYILPVIVVLFLSVCELFGGLLFHIGEGVTKKMWSYKEKEEVTDELD